MIGVRKGAWLGLLAAVGLPVSDAEAAPQQLHNKTVVISWNDKVIHTRISDGIVSTPTLLRERRVYVSSAGRLFVKGSTSVNSPQFSASTSYERGPGEGASAGVLHFEGDRLVGTGVYNGFARRVIVTFDPSFASCSASVVYGRSGGPRTWKDMKDSRITYEIQSITVAGTSCSIRDGNAVAN